VSFRKELDDARQALAAALRKDADHLPGPLRSLNHPMTVGFDHRRGAGDPQAAKSRREREKRVVPLPLETPGSRDHLAASARVSRRPAPAIGSRARWGERADVAETRSALDVSIQAQIINCSGKSCRAQFGPHLLFSRPDLSVVDHISTPRGRHVPGQDRGDRARQELYTNPKHPTRKRCCRRCRFRPPKRSGSFSRVTCEPDQPALPAVSQRVRPARAVCLANEQVLRK